MFKKQKNSKNTFLRSGTFNFTTTYNCVIEKIGGAFMLSALCMTGILGFLDFLKSAVFVVGYIQGGSLFPEPLTSEEERSYLEQMAKGNDEARNILIERNLRLVAHVA